MLVRGDGAALVDCKILRAVRCDRPGCEHGTVACAIALVIPDRNIIRRSTKRAGTTVLNQSLSHRVGRLGPVTFEQGRKLLIALGRLAARDHDT